MTYREFLENKRKKHVLSGFDVSFDDLHTMLFDFQKHIVKRALRCGKYAIFADCGLGKTFMQLEWANKVAEKTNRPVLILAPLAVGGQTIAEANRFSLHCQKYKSFCFGPGVYITNYEQIENIEDPSIFSGIVLDESSILKNFTGVYKRLIISTFQNTPYKLACTATPAPNDLNEIGNHAEYLDIMDANDMRMRWFVRDEGMNNYRLKGHAESDFYGWISSWASVLRSPEDIGYRSIGYDLPALNFINREITTEKKAMASCLMTIL